MMASQRSRKVVKRRATGVKKLPEEEEVHEQGGGFARVMLAGGVLVALQVGAVWRTKMSW